MVARVGGLEHVHKIYQRKGGYAVAGNVFTSMSRPESLCDPYLILRQSSPGKQQDSSDEQEPSNKEAGIFIRFYTAGITAFRDK